MCDKRIFFTKPEAKRAAASLRKKDKDMGDRFGGQAPDIDIRIYTCRECGYYHVGHEMISQRY